MSDLPIRVKVTSRSKKGGCAWASQCPGNVPQWGRCLFLCDPLEENYDWLVAFDNVSHALPRHTETLACPREHTILVTTEPSNITRYGKHYAGQFEYLITNQDEQVLPHKNAWRTQPGSRWYYGKSYDEIIQEPPPAKNRLLSVIATDKQQKHTIHKARFDFTRWLASQIPEADLLFSVKHKEAIFQRLFDGKARYVEHKYDMIDPYKYHLAIGNQIGPHILTERVTDSFLGYAVPITFGCTNLADYFPADSFIDIDIFKPDEAIEKIKTHIYDPNDYSRRLEALKEARRLVIEEYNLPVMLSRIIESAKPVRNPSVGGKIYSRRIMRVRHPQEFVRFMFWKIRNALFSVGINK
jgi:hypothetical protein